MTALTVLANINIKGKFHMGPLRSTVLANTKGKFNLDPLRFTVSAVQNLPNGACAAKGQGLQPAREERRGEERCYSHDPLD